MFDILTIDGSGGDGASPAFADLLNGSQYAMVSYTPGVATRRRSQLGGRSPYTDVVDTLVFTAVGATPALAYAAVETVAALVDQAETFARDEPVAPVIVSARGMQSTLAHPAQAAVLGWEGDRPTTWPMPLPQGDATYAIADVELRFRRAGLWTIPPRAVNEIGNWPLNTSTGWTSDASGGGTAVIGSVIGGAVFGSQYVAVENSAGAGVAMLYQDVTGLTAGETYHFSAYVKRTAGSNAAHLRATDGGGTSNAVDSAVTESADWVRLELDKVAPAGGSIRVWLRVGFSTTAGFNAAILEAGDTASAVADIDGARSALLAGANVVYAEFGEEAVIPSPVRARLTRADDAGAEQQGTFERCVWALTNSYDPAGTSGRRPRHINIVNAGALAGGGVAQYTAVAANQSSAPFSRSGTILRYTPTGTSETLTALANSVDMGVMTGAVVALLTVQASVSEQFTVRGRIGSVIGGATLLPTTLISEPVTVSGTARQVIVMRWPGVLANIINAAGPKFQLSVTSTAASGTLDVDSITFLAVDQHPRITVAGSTTIPMLPAETVIASYLDSGLTVSALVSSTPYRLLVDPRVPDAAHGVVGITRDDEAWDAELSYLGTPDLYISGDMVASTWLAPEGSNWRYTTGGDLVYNRLIITRRKAMLVPS